MKCVKPICTNKILLQWNKKNINTKITKQKYITRLYFKLMLNKLNVMGGPTFSYTPLGI
jgi:hypothetical protein